MRAVSDHITGTSPIMIAVIVGSSILSIGGVAYGLSVDAPAEFSWNSFPLDYKILWGVFAIVLLLMTALIWMMLNLSITIKGDKDVIKARIYPFMRSYREVQVSDIVRIEVLSYKSGISKYGGVGYKKQLGGLTSYTLHLNGHTLRMILANKKELHVEISKIKEWKRYVESFQNGKL